METCDAILRVSGLSSPNDYRRIITYRCQMPKSPRHSWHECPVCIDGAWGMYHWEAIGGDS